MKSKAKQSKAKQSKAKQKRFKVNQTISNYLKYHVMRNRLTQFPNQGRINGLNKGGYTAKRGRAHCQKGMSGNTPINVW